MALIVGNRGWGIAFGVAVLTVVGVSCLVGFAQESASSPAAAGKRPLKVLIVDGQNNHAVWPKTSEMMRGYLLETGLFTVELARTQPKGEDPDFAPRFQDFDVVVSNYNGADWPIATQQAFEKFIENGGGLVVVHAADNAFPSWKAYNRMIGLGGWGDRNETHGPYLYLNDRAELVRDKSAGSGGSHGAYHSFPITVRMPEHPIMQGMPQEWLHTPDELYDRLRGPAENLEVLATAFADPKRGGSGRHEPQVLVVSYGQGRVFHTTLGHSDESQSCVGFITLLQRGAEWAATGQVTQEVPADFPTSTETRARQPRPATPTAPAPPPTAANVQGVELGSTVNPTQFGPLFFGGQISPDDSLLLKAKGIKTIVSLRNPSEVDWNEAAWAESQGFKYLCVPCGRPSEVSRDSLQSIFQVLDRANDQEKVLLHCGNGNRVSALWCLYRAQHQQIAPEQAWQEARLIGLTAPSLIADLEKLVPVPGDLKADRAP